MKGELLEISELVPVGRPEVGPCTSQGFNIDLAMYGERAAFYGRSRGPRRKFLEDAFARHKARGRVDAREAMRLAYVGKPRKDGGR